MCEKTKDEAEVDKNRDSRSYYYDDAHGYEDFDPNEASDGNGDAAESA